MALTFLTIGKCVFALVAVCVGGRLVGEVRVARRRGDESHERGLGLHAIALIAIVLGGIGLLMQPIGIALGSPATIVASEFGIRAGMLALCLFLMRTFRPGQLVGRLVGGVCGLVLLASMGWDLVAQPSLVDYDYTRPSSHVNQLAIAAVFFWASFESASAWSAGRRRLALGLIEAAVVRSFGLWAIATAALTGIGLFAIVAGFAEAAGAERISNGAHAFRGLLYLVVTASVWRGLFRSAGSGTAAEPTAPAGPE